MRAAAIACVLLLALPIAVAFDVVSFPDPAGDQDVDLLYWGPFERLLDEPAACEDPRADVVDVHAAATSDLLRVRVLVADAEAPLRCADADLGLLPTTRGFPSFRIDLVAPIPEGGTTTVARIVSTMDDDGAFTQCVGYGNSYSDMTCTPQAGAWIDVPTTATTPDGRGVDLRGGAYRLAGHAVDSYGTSDPKGNLLLFWDDITTTSDFPIAVPAGP